MGFLRFIFISVLIMFTGCNSPQEQEVSLQEKRSYAKGALLTTSFTSLEDFKKEVSVEYSPEKDGGVMLTHTTSTGTVVSILEPGVSEADFLKAKTSGLLEKIKLGIRSPYFVSNRMDLLKVYFLSRRRHKDFGWPDQAFFDLAESMKNNIFKADLDLATEDELSEKGYINTFNHVIAQALMTSLFSEELADFVADTHERKNMPALLTGKFTEDQVKDIKNGAVDNYVDIINNEWGQEIGNRLKQKYQINQKTKWNGVLLADYLNDCQSYFSRVFNIRFNPFTENENITIHFSHKINKVMDDVSGMW